MPIELDDPNAKARYPIVKGRAIGDAILLMLIKSPEQRDQQKKNDQTGQLEKVPNGRGGFKKELVVTGLALPGTTAPKGPITEPVAVEPGEIIRVILKGKSYGEWIDADKALPKRQVGDVLGQRIDKAVTYDQNGNVTGELTTVEQVNAVPRGVSVGHYGTLGIRRATADEQEWVTKAEAAHMADREPIALEEAPAADVSAAFGQPPATPSVAGAAPFPGQAPAAPSWPAAS